jgi:hypothetical protein
MIYECWERDQEDFESREEVESFDEEMAAAEYAERRNEEYSMEDQEIFVIEKGESEEAARLYVVSKETSIDYSACKATRHTCKGCSKEILWTRLEDPTPESLCESCDFKRYYEENKRRKP